MNRELVLQVRVTREVLVVLVAVVALVVAFGAMGVASAAGKQINGCSNKQSGLLEIVRSTRECNKGENAISWNHTGPRGPVGARGEQGEQGQRGPQGIQGERGLQGLQGLQGIRGEQGEAGKTILSGDGAPDVSLGVDGDYYMDNTSDSLYGPKTNGDWGAATSLVGPQGDQGVQGERGPAGFGSLSYRTASSASGTGDLFAYAECPSSEVALGGGFSTGTRHINVRYSRPGARTPFEGTQIHPLGRQGWFVWAYNADTLSQTIDVHVICAPASS